MEALYPGNMTAWPARMPVLRRFVSLSLMKHLQQKVICTIHNSC